MKIGVKSLVLMAGLVLAVVLYFLRTKPAIKTGLDILTEHAIMAQGDSVSGEYEDLLAELRGLDESQRYNSLANFWQGRNRALYGVYKYYDARSAKTSEAWKESALAMNSAYRSAKDTSTGIHLYGFFVNCSIESADNFLKEDSVDIEMLLLQSSNHFDGQNAIMQGVMKLRKVVEIDPKNFEANMQLGQLSLQSGQYSKALPRFGVVLNHDRANLRGLMGKGNAFAGLSQKDSAIFYFKEALSLIEDNEMKEELETIINQLKN